MTTETPLLDQLVTLAYEDSKALHECMEVALDQLSKLSRRIKKKKIKKKKTSYSRKLWEDSRVSLKKCHVELVSLQNRIEVAKEKGNMAELFFIGSYIYENLTEIVRWQDVLQEV